MRVHGGPAEHQPAGDLVVGEALGDEDRARDHYEQALALYTELGVPEADEVRAELG